MEMKTKTKTAEKRCALGLLLLLLILHSTPGGEARICRQESGRFKGFCVSDRNCNNVCVAEGFEGGDCEGHLNRRCICIKRCSTTPQPKSTTTARVS